MANTTKKATTHPATTTESLTFLKKKEAILAKRAALAQQKVKTNPSQANVATASQIQMTLHAVQHRIKTHPETAATTK